MDYFVLRHILKRITNVKGAREMRKVLMVLAILIMFGILTFGSLTASADTVNVSDVSQLQSSHPYINVSGSYDTTWVYTHPGDAAALKITFSKETNIAYYDKLMVYDANDKMICSYSTGTVDGTPQTLLAGKTLEIEGNVFKIRLKGSYVGYYGFSIDEIAEVDYSLSPNIVSSGACGSNTRYQLDDKGTMYITGTGYMSDYTYNLSPWYFKAGNIKRLIVEEGVSGIGAYAFQECVNLTCVKLPSSLLSIGEYAFSKCTKLTNITIDKGVKSIYDGAFKDCTALLGIVLPDDMRRIGRYAFENTFYYNYTTWGRSFLAIDKYIIRGTPSVTGISAYEFEPYELIADGAFKDCEELEYVTIGGTIRIIGDWAFHSCGKLVNVYHESVSNVSGSSPGLGVVDIKMNSKLEKIGEHAFAFCSVLTRIDIPNSVKIIGDYAFQNSSSLAKVNYIGDSEEWLKIEIGSVYNANGYLWDAERRYLYSVAFYTQSDSRYEFIYRCIDANGVIPCEYIPSYSDYVVKFYTDESCKLAFDFTKPVEKNTWIYMKKYPSVCTYKFVDENGEIIKEEKAGFGSIISPPEQTPQKPSTAQYTYTFSGWSGFYEGYELTQDIVFTATYTSTINRYSHFFIDEDGTVLKEETVDYGTQIIPPENPSKEGNVQYSY